MHKVTGIFLEECVSELANLIEECYDGLATWKGWMRGAGQERSRQLKCKVDWGEEGICLDG